MVGSANNLNHYIKIKGHTSLSFSLKKMQIGLLKTGMKNISNTLRTKNQIISKGASVDLSRKSNGNQANRERLSSLE